MNSLRMQIRKEVKQVFDAASNFDMGKVEQDKFQKRKELIESISKMNNEAKSMEKKILKLAKEKGRQEEAEDLVNSKKWRRKSTDKDMVFYKKVMSQYKNDIATLKGLESQPQPNSYNVKLSNQISKIKEKYQMENALKYSKKNTENIHKAYKSYLAKLKK